MHDLRVAYMHAYNFQGTHLYNNYQCIIYVNACTRSGIINACRCGRGCTYLEQINEDIIKRFLCTFGTKAPKRLNSFNGFFSSIQLLHYNSHVFQGAFHSISCIYCLPKPHYCTLLIPLYKLQIKNLMIYLILIEFKIFKIENN